jgi:hypothetical protein
MESEKKRLGLGWWVMAAIALSLAIYLAAYYALVDPLPDSYVSSAERKHVFLWATYRIESDWVRRAFYPAHLMDRRIRRKVWEAPPDWEKRWHCWVIDEAEFP